jgi:hypothetical protein
MVSELLNTTEEFIRFFSLGASVPAEKAILFWVFLLTGIGYGSVLLVFIATTHYKGKKSEYDMWRSMVFLDRLFFSSILGAFSYISVMGFWAIVNLVRNIFGRPESVSTLTIQNGVVLATIFCLLNLSINAKKKTKGFFDKLSGVVGRAVIFIVAVVIVNSFLVSLSNLLGISIPWLDTKPSGEDWLNVIIMPIFAVCAVIEIKTKWFSKKIKKLEKLRKAKDKN